MFEDVKEVKWRYTFVDPCVPCEHSHACAECPHNTSAEAKPSPYRDGKLIVASGEDAHVFA